MIYDYTHIGHSLPVYGTPTYFLNHIFPKILNLMKANFMVCVWVSYLKHPSLSLLGHNDIILLFSL